MPVHREKESSTERKKLTKESSITRKVKRDKPEDGRPIVTQDKPNKSKTVKVEKVLKREPSTSSSSDVKKTKTDPSKVKTKEKEDRAAKPKIRSERDKTVEKKKTEDPVKKKVRKEVVTMKDVLDKRMSTRLTRESSLQESPKKLRKTKEGDIFGEKVKERPEVKEKVKKEEKEKVRKEEKEKVRKEERDIKNLKSEKSKRERTRTRTRTLSPTEVKQLRRPHVNAGDSRDIGVRDDKQKRIERGRGDMGNIDRRNFVVEERKEVKQEEEEEEVPEEEEEEENYEDDFEDYESDFEEGTESDENSNDEKEPELEPEPEPEPEPAPSPDLNRNYTRSVKSPETRAKIEETEKKMDSGIYDMKASLHKKEIEEIKTALKKENYELEERRKSSGGLIREPAKRDKIQTNDNQMINFSNLKKRRQEEKVAAKAKKRGEELLSMITLDAISYSLLEIPAIPYEVYMKTYGRSNTQQAHAQTNEDDLDEEIQTEPITTSNKWTQYPPEFSLIKDKNKEIQLPTKEEKLGVGGDVPLPPEPYAYQFSTNRLGEFLIPASQMILTILEAATMHRFNAEKISKHKNDFPFADGFISLNVKQVPFLKKRSISTLCLSPKNITSLLSVHEGSINTDDPKKRCMICLWSIQEPSKPSKILIASNQITSCCFGPNQGNLIFAGFTDGSVCLWDLRESSAFHEATVDSETGWTFRSPTYSTAEILKENGHFSPVVAIKLLTKIEDISKNQDFTPVQICTLEKRGTIIIWSVIQNRGSKKQVPNDDLGLAHWGKIKLVKNSSFSVFSTVRDDIPQFYITCNDLALNEAEDNGLFVTNSLGNVYHLSTYGSLMKPKFYGSNKNEAVVETMCLEMCPFDSNYFLVGCGDGSIRLHSRHQEFPLICLNGNVIENGKEAAIISLVWLYMRPCVFFALDSLSRIHVWDMGISDMYPEVTLNLVTKVTSMKLTVTNDRRQIPYLILGTVEGNIEVHRLNKDYGARSPEERHKEMKMFLRYVSIL